MENTRRCTRSIEQFLCSQIAVTRQELTAKHFENGGLPMTV